jgi:hypothetical protein
MIKKEELRIGNIVSLNGERVIVESISELLNYKYEYNHIDGMPISIEELERFGYKTYRYIGTGDFNLGGEKNVSIFDEKYKKTYWYKIHISSNIDNSWIIEYSIPSLDKEDISIMGIRTLRYMHDLQNIYQGNTGLEL